ncbi:MAG: hypothetical protein AAF960_05210 [Bacteroidota bacterium]
MNQFHWTYWDHFGRQHVVGILHGLKTGHLLIHLNSKVLIIDFNVFQPKKYSFLINEEICELKIEGAGKEFKYNLGVNEQQAAERKALKKKEARQFLYQQIGAVVATSLLLFTISAFIYFLKHY